MGYGLHNKPMRGEYDALGYRAAEVARKGDLQISATGDFHSRYDRVDLVNACRQADRDNPIFNGLVTRLTDNIIGETGFTLQARVRTSNGRKLDRRTNDIIEKELWPAFAESPEIRGFYDWTGVEQVVMRDLLVAGDIGAIKLRNGQIQLIEAECIASTNAKNGNNLIEQGIEIDTYGMPVAYWIGQPSDYGECQTEGRRVLAQDFVYVHGSGRRISQTRPVPPFVSSFPNIHRMNDILNAEAIAWQLLARFALKITKREADIEAYNLSEDDAAAAYERNTTMDPATLADRAIDTPEGTIFWGDASDNIEGIKHEVPGANFPESIATYLRLIGMQIGLPLELVLLDWSKTNFSSARAALEQAYVMLRRWQRTIVRQLHKPVYEWKIAQWVAEGRIPDRPDIAAAEWIANPFPFIDPQKDAEARGTLLDRGLSTYSASLKATGQDLTTIQDQTEDTIRSAIERANKITAETGERVPWQIFAGYQVGKTEAAVTAKAPNNGSEKSEKKEPMTDEQE
jgi:lambda family phage portal protein